MQFIRRVSRSTSRLMLKAIPYHLKLQLLSVMLDTSAVGKNPTVTALGRCKRVTFTISRGGDIWYKTNADVIHGEINFSDGSFVQKRVTLYESVSGGLQKKCFSVSIESGSLKILKMEVDIPISA